MVRKRKSPKTINHSVQAKKKPNPDFGGQCELGPNIYRLALKAKENNLLLSQVPHSLSVVEATQQIRDPSNCIESNTSKQNEPIPNVDVEIDFLHSSPQSLQSVAVNSPSSSQSIDNRSANVRLPSEIRSAQTNSVFYEPQPLEAEANNKSTVLERIQSEVKFKVPSPGQSQVHNVHTNTFRSNQFGSANFQWLREINFNSISAKLFIDMEAEYAQVVRAQLIGERRQFKCTDRAVAIYGQNPNTILKLNVINLNEYLQVLCALRAFLTRYRQPDHVIETPLHFIFCHLFEFQSDFRKLRTTEGIDAVAHNVYFFAS